MESWGVAFLGVIALGSLVQTAFLIGILVMGRRLGRRVDEMQGRFEREMRPSLDSLSRVTRNLAEVSDLATLQARRIDEALADTLDKVQEATSNVHRFFVRPLGPLADVAAVIKGLRRGLDVYHRLSGLDSPRKRVPPRRHAAGEDEHLFI
jgi:hypothetical protein